MDDFSYDLLIKTFCLPKEFKKKFLATNELAINRSITVTHTAVLYPLGVVPTLEVDGKILPESIPLARYVAVEFGALFLFQYHSIV